MNNKPNKSTGCFLSVIVFVIGYFALGATLGVYIVNRKDYINGLGSPFDSSMLAVLGTDIILTIFFYIFLSFIFRKK